jgi:hypothetical protein
LIVFTLKLSVSGTPSPRNTITTKRMEHHDDKSESDVEEEVVKDYCNCSTCLDADDCRLRDPTPIPPCLWMNNDIVPQSKANRMVYDAKRFAKGFFIVQERLHVGEIDTSILCGSSTGMVLLSRRSSDCLLTRDVIDKMMEIAKLKYERCKLEIESNELRQEIVKLTQEIEKLEEKLVGGDYYGLEPPKKKIKV